MKRITQRIMRNTHFLVTVFSPSTEDLDHKQEGIRQLHIQPTQENTTTWTINGLFPTTGKSAGFLATICILSQFLTLEAQYYLKLLHHRRYLF